MITTPDPVILLITSASLKGGYSAAFKTIFGTNYVVNNFKSQMSWPLYGLGLCESSDKKIPILIKIGIFDFISLKVICLAIMYQLING